MRLSKRKPWLVVMAWLLTGAIYVSVAAVLELTARWAEADFETYPYLAGEDPIRLLLPTVHGGTGGGTLLLGPSAIGEAFLYEELEARWGSRVRSAGLSHGTIDDFYLFLSYLEYVYGAESLPNRVVLGMSPRELGNLPRLFGPYREPGATPYTGRAIDRYSTRFRVVRGELGTELVPKTASEAVLAWFRFHVTKQQPRYRSGMLAAIEYLLDPDPLKLGFLQGYPGYSGNPRNPFTGLNFATTVSFIREVGAVRAARSWLRAHRSAYTYLLMKPDDEVPILGTVAGVGFDARQEMPMVRMQLERIDAFFRRHNIELVVVNLPEHRVLRSRYDPKRYAAYLHAIRQYLPMARFVDLWDALSEDAFFDQIHLRYDGARRATQLLADAIGIELKTVSP